MKSIGSQRGTQVDYTAKTAPMTGNSLSAPLLSKGTSDRLPATMQFTKISEISGVVSSAREAFEKGTTTPIAWRIQQITQIKKALLENKEIIIQALQADLRRPAFETFMAEIMTVVGECDFALANLKSWVKPERVGTPAVMLPGSSYIHKDPLGTVSSDLYARFALQSFSPITDC